MNAWLTLASCLWLILISGTIYGFGEWSGLLKQNSGYDYDQETLETIALIAQFGNYVILDSGLLVSRTGTLTGMVVGCIYACSGYLGMWTAVKVFPGQLSFKVLALFAFLYGHGCGTIDNAVITQLVADFPDHHGNSIGCAKAFYGLATAVVATIYDAVFAPEQDDFLLFLGIYSGIVGIIAIPIISATRGQLVEPAWLTRRKFGFLVAGIVAFAVYFFFVQIFMDELSQLEWARGLILAIIIGGALSVFLLACSCSSGKDAEGQERAMEGTDREHAHQEKYVVDMTLRDIFLRFEFYVLMIVLLVGQGSGLLFVINAPQIYSAYLGEAAEGKVSFVAVMSIFNAMGRLTFGNVSAVLAGTVHRTWFLVFSLATIGFSYLLIYLIGSPVLWIVAAMIAFGFGGIWGIQPTLVSEILGSNDFSFKYACTTLAAFTGSFLFSELLAANLYDQTAEDLGDAPHCYSPVCFGTAFVVTGCSIVPALVLACYFCNRTAWIYEQRAEGGGFKPIH